MLGGNVESVMSIAEVTSDAFTHFSALLARE